MARLRFPDAPSIDRVQATAGTALLSASGATAVVYLNDAGTQLADDLLDAVGVPVTDGTFLLNSLSRWPEFDGPTSGQQRLWARIDGGAPIPLDATVDSRLDAQNLFVDETLDTFQTSERAFNSATYQVLLPRPTGVAATDRANLLAAIADLDGVGGEVLGQVDRVGNTGLYLTGTSRVVIPGGVTLVGTGVEYSNPSAAPGRGVIFAPSGAVDVAFQLGVEPTVFGSEGANHSSFGSGNSGAALRRVIIDGGNLAGKVVEAIAPRWDVDRAQITRGLTHAFHATTGQNGAIDGQSVISQDDRGTCVQFDFPDNKLLHAQVRGGTVARVHVKADNTEIRGAHIFPNGSSEIGPDIIFDAMRGAQVAGVIFGSGAQTDPHIVVRNIARAIVVGGGTRAYLNGLSAAGPPGIPFMRIEASGGRDILIDGVQIDGMGDTARYSSIVQAMDSTTALNVDIGLVQAIDVPALAVGFRANILGATAGVNGSVSHRLGCKAVTATAQTLTSGTVTPVTFTAEEWDFAPPGSGWHSTVTNPSRFTVPPFSNGRVLIVASATFSSNAVGRRHLQIRKNAAGSPVGGTIVPGSRLEVLPSSGGLTSMQVSVEDSPVAGDYYELFALQTSGGDLTLDPGAGTGHPSTFSIRRINS